jgi:hypothetical protein
VLVSPGGLLGIWDSAFGGGARRLVGHARQAITGRRPVTVVETRGSDA